MQTSSDWSLLMPRVHTSRFTSPQENTNEQDGLNVSGNRSHTCAAMIMRRARDNFLRVMMQMRREFGVRPLLMLMTCPGPHHFGMNSTRNGKTPCSHTSGKLAVSIILGVRIRNMSVGLSPPGLGVPNISLNLTVQRKIQHMESTHTGLSPGLLFDNILQLLATLSL
jgi:hypothetical protein